MTKLRWGVINVQHVKVGQKSHTRSGKVGMSAKSLKFAGKSTRLLILDLL